MMAGDRVRVRQPARAGGPWHTLFGRSYDRECKPGDVGTLDTVKESTAGRYAHVTWDHGQTSNIDLKCLEPYSEETELDAEARRLFGLTAPGEKHCKTCTCTD